MICTHPNPVLNETTNQWYCPDCGANDLPAPVEATRPKPPPADSHQETLWEHVKELL